MSNIQIELFSGPFITDDLLAPAAKLFSANYGTWGRFAASKMGPFAKQGARIKMTSQILKQKVVAAHGSVYVRALLDGVLLGNVFSVCYEHEGRSICWITQLAVSSTYRNRGLAKQLLYKIHQSSPNTETAYGILSSHPFAICAFLRVFCQGIEEFNGTEKGYHAVMESCPVDYVREAKVGREQERICCANTGFWVDHEEPMDALMNLKSRGVNWPLGELPDGCEFLAIVEANKT